MNHLSIPRHVDQPHVALQFVVDRESGTGVRDDPPSRDQSPGIWK
jgi:hypothetical protein